MRAAMLLPTPGSSVSRVSSTPVPSGAAFSSVSAARSYAMNLKNASPANSIRVRISRKRSAISRLVSVAMERGLRSMPAYGRPMLRTEHRRLDPAILNLPLEKKGGGDDADGHLQHA